MTNTTTALRRIPRSLAVAAVAAVGVLAPLAAASSAAAVESTPAPSCVEYYPSWRYTQVHNGCSDAEAVAVQYQDGTVSPCQVIQADGWMTYAGYGTTMNYVTGLLTCDPAATATGQG
ncbi:alpha-amylase [Kitasatospora phosalacinea]|nr:alpha-amylase [Kitasatospora phosalacinea]